MRRALHVSILGEPNNEVIRALRLTGNLSLQQAQVLASAIHSSGESLLANGVRQESADHLCTLLSNAGVKTRVTEASVDQPMLLFPQLERRFQWSRFRTIYEI
jgi:hypothetical protein